MIPWILLDTAPVPGCVSQLHLYQRGTEFSIRIDQHELMNSRMHGSEDALAEIVLARGPNRASPKLLIGGLGMGYTAAAALQRLPDDGCLIVAELVEGVVRWNQGPLADLNGRPLEDNRVTVRVEDVAQILKGEKRAYDGIVLDVDNGPRGLTRHENNWLYSQAGLSAAYSALRSGGVLAVWSAGPDESFTKRLKATGFSVEETRVRSRGTGKGGWHTIWLGARGG